MSFSLRFETIALQELKQAARWYDECRSGLGQQFMDAVDQLIVRVLENPYAFPKSPNHALVRRAVMKRFPFIIVFVVHEQEVHVLSISHSRRRPGHWISRLARTRA